MDVYIGFDSAWTDNPKAPGAICAIAIKDRQPLRFFAPQFVSFNQGSRSSRASVPMTASRSSRSTSRPWFPTQPACGQ